MKYKVGDKVRIINNEETIDIAEINDIAYIEKIDESNVPYCCRIVSKDTIVWLCEEDITKAEYTWEDFLKAPIGTKVTFEDTILVKSDANRFENETELATYEFIESFNRKDGFGKIIKIEEPTYTTVYEPKKVTMPEIEEMKRLTDELFKICDEVIKNYKEKENSND